MVTFDLGRVTTLRIEQSHEVLNCGDVRSRTSYNSSNCQVISSQSYCGDVRSRTSYNLSISLRCVVLSIVVTFDLGRVTTAAIASLYFFHLIVVTFDLGRVTTSKFFTSFSSSELW